MGLQNYVEYIVAEISHEVEQKGRNDYMLMALYAISSQKQMSKTYQELTDTLLQDDRSGDKIVEDVTADFNSILKKGG